MSRVDPNQITIVSGLPRSGTSMMMRMVDAGGIPALTDHVRAADEDNPRGYFEFEPVKKTGEDSSWLEQAGGRVVKMVYRLLYDLPDGRDYHIVFMQRRLEEVIASQDVMLARRGRGGGEMGADKLKGLFEQQLAEFRQWAAERPGFHMLEINYNDVIQNPRPAVAALNAFLGGQLDTDAMMRVVEPDLYRQRRSE
jgi:hypothetical protein